MSKVKPGAEKTQGLEYINPADNNVRIRVMPGNPNSRFPNSREPYVRQTVNKDSVSKHGNIVSRSSDDAHIPLKDFKFKIFWKNHVKK